MLNGYTKIIIATFLFSLSPLFIRWIDLDAISLLWAISIIVGIVLFSKTVIQGRIRELMRFDKGLKLLFGLGLFTTINNTLFFSSIKITTIANAILTHYLAPVFVLIFAVFLLKEKITKISILALVLSFTGLGIMLYQNEFVFSNVHFLGLVLGISSAIFFSLEILSKKILTRFYKADIINIRYLLISVLLLTPFVSYDKILTIDMTGLSLLLVWSTFIIAVGITLFISGLKEVEAQHAGVISYVEPLGAILWGFLIISEIPTIETIIGGSLILIGTYLIIRNKTPR